MPTLYQAAWIFLIYAFLGWCTEVVFQAMCHGKFINRGFLNGPVCPIYGFGVLLVVSVLSPLKGNLLLLFIASLALTSTLEFVTGLVLEKCFHDKWWDYSREPFNIMGYVCLRFSVAWGLACVFVVEIVHPSVMKLIGLIPERMGVIALSVLLCALTADTVVTVNAAGKMVKRLESMTKLSKQIHAMSDAIGEPLAQRAIDVRNRLEQKKPELDALETRLHSIAQEPRAIERRLLRSFPRLQQGRFAEGIRRIEEHFPGLMKPKKDDPAKDEGNHTQQ